MNLKKSTFLSHIDSSSQRLKLLLFVAFLTINSISVLIFYDTIGYGVHMLMVIPISIISWVWGKKMGLKFFISCVLMNNIITFSFFWPNISEYLLSFTQIMFIIGHIAIIFICMVIGTLNDFLKKIRTSEQKLKEKTKELKKVLDIQKQYSDQILKSSQFKSEFLASMSHELRTPLNAIIGFSDLLLEESYGQLNLEQKNFLEDIVSSGNHLLAMINQILDLSKIEAGKLKLIIQKISLDKILQSLISVFRPLYSKRNIKFEVLNTIEPNKFIYADPIRFKEILYNLISNAIKFTIKGKITLKILEIPDFWEFSVVDTGIGIAENDYNIVFKEFRRINSPYVQNIEGTGLGLSLTKRLVNLHGGDINFTSEIGKGSTFIFTIPKIIEKKT